jgi:hypothetical protein
VRLQQRVRDLEAENATLRGATRASDRGLVAALEGRATEAVVVSPGEQPGASEAARELTGTDQARVPSAPSASPVSRCMVHFSSAAAPSFR